MENHLHMEARVLLDIIIIRHIKNWVWACLPLEEFHTFYMIAQEYYLFPGIQVLKRYLIRQDKIEYIIASTIKLLVVTITGL